MQSTDLDGIVLSWNQGATALLGPERGEAVGRPVSALIGGPLAEVSSSGPRGHRASAPPGRGGAAVAQAGSGDQRPAHPRGNTGALYRDLIEAAVDVTDADRGTLQALDEETGELILLAAVGLSAEMTQRFARVRPDGPTSYALALGNAGRVVVDYAKHVQVVGTPDACAPGGRGAGRPIHGSGGEARAAPGPAKAAAP